MAAEVVKIPKRRKADKPEATAKATKSGKRVSPGKKNPGNRFVGKTTGLGVLEYQNQSLENNRKAKKTDEQLAAEWRKEFPMAKAYTAEDVAGVRNSYNKGKHGNVAPVEAKRIPEFDDAGEAKPFWGERAAAKRAAKEETDEAPAPKRRKVVNK